MKRSKQQNMRTKKVVYTEIGAVDISPTRRVVLSARSRGGYTLAQQIDVTEDNGEKTQLFIKGAFHISNSAILGRLAEMLEAAAVSESEWENGEENSKNA